MLRSGILVVAIITLVCVSSAWAATTYTGSLSTRHGEEGDTSDGLLGGNGTWVVGITTLDWTVSQNADLSWRYDYTLRIVQDHGDISHFVVETSTDFGPGDIETTWPEDQWDIKLWKPTENGAFPNMPGEIYGVKFETEYELLWTNIVFDAPRMPVWGDFYAEDGTAGCNPGEWNEAWNAGFLAEDPTAGPANGSEDHHLLVPDTESQPPPGDDAPELGTWLLLACTGVFGIGLRRRKR